MNKQRINPSPNISPEELLNDLVILEKEIKDNDFISAYNRIKKIMRELARMPTLHQTTEIKSKCQKLNNELNLKILRFMSDKNKP